MAALTIRKRSAVKVNVILHYTDPDILNQRFGHVIFHDPFGVVLYAYIKLGYSTLHNLY